MELGLRDKVAAITGASAGIGLAIAEGLTAEGVHLVMAARDPGRLSDVAAVRLARGLVPSMRPRGGGVILHNGSIGASQPLWHEPIHNVTRGVPIIGLASAMP
jgi:NADP-dependent 3-hydroxy acid dehydrogenase YdfG